MLKNNGEEFFTSDLLLQYMLLFQEDIEQPEDHHFYMQYEEEFLAIYLMLQY